VTPDPHELARHLDALVLAVRTATADRAELSLTAAATLARLQAEGPARITGLATAEGVSQPSMTALAARLSAQGLVRRQQDPADGRAVVLSLTDAGADLLARRRADRTARLAPYLAGLSPHDQRRIAEALPALDALAGALRRTTPEISMEEVR
jgi:DNA-binding MarR family transcriptional regulator